MNESFLSAVRDALALLIKLRGEHVPVDAAQALFRELKSRHPDRWMNLVWERETYTDAIHYDILMDEGAGTVSVSYCADEETPWPVRGLQRVNESLVLRVNNQSVRIGAAITSLDYAWHTLHVGRHLLDMVLIDLAIRARGIEATREELDAALLRFRRQRRLFTREQVERWMLEHGTTQAQLEEHLAGESARERLQREIAAGREEAYFEAHRADFDRVQVARIYVADPAEARRLYERLRTAPGQFLEIARAHFLETAKKNDLFVTLERGDLDSEQAAILFATAPGEVAAPIPSGDGFELAQVLRFLPARLDEATRERISNQLFESWLEGERRRARVEWFWGEAEAADLPAASL